MPSFKDRNGREWKLSLTVGDLPALREMNFDHNALATGNGLAALMFNEPEKLVTLCHLLAHEQTKGVTAEEFAAGFDGPALEAAGFAVLEACVSFTRPSGIAAQTMTLFRREWETLGGKFTTWTGSNGSAGNSPAAPG